MSEGGEVYNVRPQKPGMLGKFTSRFRRKKQEPYTALQEAGLTWVQGIDHQARIEGILEGKEQIRGLLKDEEFEQAIDVADRTLTVYAFPWATAGDNPELAETCKGWVKLYKHLLRRRRLFKIAKLRKIATMENKGERDAKTGQLIQLTPRQRTHLARYKYWCEEIATAGFFALTKCFRSIHVGPQKIIVIYGMPRDRGWGPMPLPGRGMVFPGAPGAGGGRSLAGMPRSLPTDKQFVEEKR